MGLFSKLFGNAIEEKVVKNVLDDVFRSAANPASNQSGTASYNEPVRHSEPAASATISDEIPSEENQYNFNGSYIDYFDKIFHEEFPQYDITREKAEHSRTATIFTFRSAGSVALYVELMSENSSINKFRTRCQKSGIPYLRYYYNHRGWWNTRSYVTERTRKALGC